MSLADARAFVESLDDTDASTLNIENMIANFSTEMLRLAAKEVLAESAPAPGGVTIYVNQTLKELCERSGNQKSVSEKHFWFMKIFIFISLHVHTCMYMCICAVVCSYVDQVEIYDSILALCFI